MRFLQDGRAWNRSFLLTCTNTAGYRESGCEGPALAGSDQQTRGKKCTEFDFFLFFTFFFLLLCCCFSSDSRCEAPRDRVRWRKKKPNTRQHDEFKIFFFLVFWGKTQQRLAAPAKVESEQGSNKEIKPKPD